MLLRIKLTDADREKYGLPETVELDLERPRLLDVRRLKLNVFVPTGDGRRRGMEWAELRNGVLSGSEFSNGAALWIAARRAGAEVAWEEFDIDVNGIDVDAAEGEDPNSSAPDGAKPKSTRSPRTSRASTASARGKSSSSPRRSSSAS